MMEDKILTKEEVLQNGVCFEEVLDWGGWYCEQIVSENESGEEIPFTGLAYDLYPDGKLEYYGYIKDGFRHGMNVLFYPNGNIESINPQDCGAADGLQKKYYENGALKSQEYCVLGARVTYIEYDEAGHITNEKLEPTDADFERAKKWGVDLSKRDMTLK